MESVLRRNNKKVKFSPENSPKLEEMIEVTVDSKTKLYFKPDTSLLKIAERVALHQKKLCSVPVQLEENYIIKGARKTAVV